MSLLPTAPATLHREVIKVSFNLVISLLWVHLPSLKVVGPTWLKCFLVFASRATLRSSALQNDLLPTNRSPLGSITVLPVTSQQVSLRRLKETGYIYSPPLTTLLNGVNVTPLLLREVGCPKPPCLYSPLHSLGCVLWRPARVIPNIPRMPSPGHIEHPPRLLGDSP